MFSYEKKLEYPVKIATPNPKLAAMIISQYGGPDTTRLRKTGADRSGSFLFRAAAALLVTLFSTALEKLGLPPEQPIQVGGFQPCRQPAALAVIQVIRVHKPVSDMYEGYRPDLRLLGHMVHLPIFKLFSDGRGLEPVFTASNAVRAACRGQRFAGADTIRPPPSGHRFDFPVRTLRRRQKY